MAIIISHSIPGMTVADLTNLYYAAWFWFLNVSLLSSVVTPVSHLASNVAATALLSNGLDRMWKELVMP
jgi:hypothetical protein